MNPCDSHVTVAGFLFNEFILEAASGKTKPRYQNNFDTKLCHIVCLLLCLSCHSTSLKKTPINKLFYKLLEQYINTLHLSNFVAVYCQLWVIFYKDVINKDVNRNKERNHWLLQYDL